MKTIKKVSSEWIKEYDCKIIDPDGWDRKNYDYSFNIEKITRKEFEFNLKLILNQIFLKPLWKEYSMRLHLY